MRVRHRAAIAAGSVGVIAAAILMALYVGPAEGRLWLSAFGLAAVTMVFPSLFVNPRDLLATLVLSLPPVLSFASEGAPVWSIAPVAVLLLVGAELIAFSWESEGPSALRIDGRRRLGRIAQLAALALVASLAATVAARRTWFDATVAVAAAAIALAGLAWVIFPRGRRPDRARVS